MRVGKKGKEVVSAEWVDQEVKDNIDKRQKPNKIWRKARVDRKTKKN